AAARLHAALAGAELDWDRVVLVVEGRARDGVREGAAGGIVTVHAPGSGDDELVAQCEARTAEGDRVTLVTADRGLITRVAGLAVTTLGPRALRDLAGL
ncbi:MAG: hypothetical protein Q4F67_02725, partial [Propionibacteriaceae bacterium]|nr:hypothetical protein [Propionibacteriaceae bacterium]